MRRRTIEVVTVFNQGNDPVRRIAMEKLKSLGAKLEASAGDIRTRLAKKELKEETRSALKQKLLELEHSMYEISCLEERVFRL
jgi:hypothetical protein